MKVHHCLILTIQKSQVCMMCYYPSKLFYFSIYILHLVSASSPSHQVLGSKPSLCRISTGVRLCFSYSLPQTLLVWEPLALGLPFFIYIASCVAIFVKYANRSCMDPVTELLPGDNQDR
jgi:hypothetical protein